MKASRPRTQTGLASTGNTLAIAMQPHLAALTVVAVNVFS